jgi:hypothetical protein
MPNRTWMARRAALVLALVAFEIAAFVWGFAARACQPQFSLLEGLKYLGLFLFICTIATIRFPLASVGVALVFGASGFIRVSLKRDALLRTLGIGVAVAAALVLTGVLLAGNGSEGACDLHIGF